ncbi:MAG: DMT family transporter [Alphaproteobacteria bacterium]|nr:MAG: DMT family transporter [Alphaproteobacteria bacterium]
MARLSDNARGSLLMMGSMAAFTFNDACMKALAGRLPLEQAVFLRGLATTVMMYLLARRLGGLRFDLPGREWRLILLRALADIGATAFFLTALFHMPIANVTAILQVLPLTVTLAGALFLGEPVGWRRLLAILVGLAGVLIIVRPGFAGFNAYSVHVLVAVGFVTLRDLVARGLSVGVPSMTAALVNAAAITASFGIASAFVDWAPVTGRSALLLAGASVLIIGGYLFSVSAMRLGEIAVVAPFRYTALLWALLVGIAVFGEWPDGATLIGAALVVATGLYTFYRERRVARAGLRKRAVDKG